MFRVWFRPDQQPWKSTNQVLFLFCYFWESDKQMQSFGHLFGVSIVCWEDSGSNFSLLKLRFCKNVSKFLKNHHHAVPVKSKVEISQIFEAFFKYMNFITSNCPKFIRAFSQLFFDLSRNPLCFFTEKRVVQTAGDVVYDRSSISS